MNSEVIIPGDTVIKIVKHWATTEDCNTSAFVSVYPNGVKHTLSRKEVFDCSKRLAFKLHSLGIGKGSIVCNTLPNSLERVICEFGIIFSGATSMNGQVFRSDGEDFIDALKMSLSIAVIVDPGAFNSSYNILVRSVTLESENKVHSEILPFLKHLIICARYENDESKDFISMLQNTTLPEFEAEVIPSDLVTIMTTSGSTGYSKLVKFSHLNICEFGRQVKAIEQLQPGSPFMNCGMLGWAGGYPQWYLSCGVTRYFLDMHKGPYPDLPEVLWRTVVSERISYGFMTPAFVNNILVKKHLWENLNWKPKCLCLAGQPVKKGVLDIIGKLCEAVDINYGLTECNLVATHRVTDTATYSEGCAGHPGYKVKLKIVDKSFMEVPQGIVGQIIVSSPTLCQGYINKDESCQKVFLPNGWFCTDDAGYIGQDGKLYVEGRQSDCIMRGTSVLYPGWLEKKLKEVPGVEDVVVVAVPDDVLYNEICACILIKGIEGSFTSSRPEKTFQNDKKNSKPSDNMTTVNTQNNGVADSKCDSQSSNLSNENGKSLLLDSQLPTQMEALEEKLRFFASSMQPSYEMDPLRVVPKYYIFLEKYPLTNGKVSRKDLRKMSTELLGL